MNWVNRSENNSVPPASNPRILTDVQITTLLIHNVTIVWMWTKENFMKSSGSGLAGINRRDYGIVKNFSLDRGIEESIGDPRKWLNLTYDTYNAEVKIVRLQMVELGWWA